MEEYASDKQILCKLKYKRRERKEEKKRKEKLPEGSRN